MSRQEDFEKSAMDYCEDHSHCIYFEFGAEYGYQYAQAHPNWISVEEMLPEENTAPLVRMDLTDKFGEETILYDVVVFDGNGFHAPYKITHWMEIQPPRKEE